MIKKLPIFKIVPVESDITEIALVDEPAIEEYFLAFSETKIKMDFQDDKMILKGAVMIPNQLIYRNDSLGERFVTYDEDAIKKSVSLFFKNGLKFNESHTENNIPIEILESYFAIEGNELGVPVGSWIVSAKVNDTDLWSRIKDNEFQGFSFQSLFSNELIGSKELNFKSEMKKDLFEQLKTAISGVLFAETPIVEGAPAPTVEEVPAEDVKALLEEFKTAVMAEVDAKILALKEELTGSVAAVDAKVEEFSKQPLSQSVKEQIAVIVPDSKESKAAQYFKN